MGRVKKGVICSIQGCNKKSQRSLSIMKTQDAVKKAGLSTKPSPSRRLYLCDSHYKQVKKHLKQAEQIERMRLRGR
ncbi:MAG: hypothetical protein ACTSW4_02600 [Candidatus Ranarchaeia archaeon]